MAGKLASNAKNTTSNLYDEYKKLCTSFWQMGLTHAELSPQSSVGSLYLFYAKTDVDDGWQGLGLPCQPDLILKKLAGRPGSSWKACVPDGPITKVTSLNQSNVVQVCKQGAARRQPR